MKHYTSTLIFFLLLGGFACKDNPPEPGTPSFQLLADDVGVTEV